MAEENTIDDEIILADLPDDELTAQMHDDLYDGLADEITEGTNLDRKSKRLNSSHVKRSRMPSSA